MPTPWELLLDPVSLATFAVMASLMLWEALWPGRELPHVPGWRLRAALSFVAYFLLSSYLPLLWDDRLSRLRILDLTALGALGGFAVALLAYEGAVYFWHRAMHGSTLLWRGVHQMHHSAERIEVIGAFYFSLMDIVGWSLLGSLVLTLGIGVSPRAATLFLLVTVFLGAFQHANVKTPRWLGYLIQRLESHTVHHARGIHAYNYSDLPIVDILFGTFRNPAGFEQDTGFYLGASGRVAEMLCMRDVSEAPAHSPRPGAVRDEDPRSAEPRAARSSRTVRSTPPADSVGVRVP